jgi:hypothetical protein
MFGDERGEVGCHIHPSEHCPTHETYGLLIADLVRHVRAAPSRSAKKPFGNGSTRNAAIPQPRSPTHLRVMDEKPPYNG